MKEECQLPIGADDVCGLPLDSPIHTDTENPMRHDFIPSEEEHPEGCECDTCILRGFWTDDEERA